MSTALQRTDAPAYESRGLRELAVDYAKTGFGGRMTPEMAFVLMVTGAEFGMSPMQALRSIHIIDNKPTIAADALVGICLKSGLCEFFRVADEGEGWITYETKRVGDPKTHTRTWTIDDAKRAQLTNRQNWKKYPRAMLKARCTADLARQVYPDLLTGVYDEDELRRNPEDGAAQPLDIEPDFVTTRDVTFTTGEGWPQWRVDAARARVAKATEAAIRDAGFEHLSDLPGVEKMGATLHAAGLGDFETLYQHIAGGFPLPGVLNKGKAGKARGLAIFNALLEWKGLSPVDALPTAAPEPVPADEDVEQPDDGAELMGELESVDALRTAAKGPQWWLDLLAKVNVDDLNPADEAKQLYLAALNVCKAKLSLALDAREVGKSLSEVLSLAEREFPTRKDIAGVMAFAVREAGDAAERMAVANAKRLGGV